MLVTEPHWKILEEKFKAFCKENGIDEKKSGDLLGIAILSEHEEKERIIPKTEILSIRQYFDSGESEVFSIGDQTTDGKILSIMATGDKFPYVTTDKPSEWHLKNGQDHGWNWTWQLEKIHPEPRVEKEHFMLCLMQSSPESRKPIEQWSIVQGDTKEAVRYAFKDVLSWVVFHVSPMSEWIVLMKPSYTGKNGKIKEGVNVNGVYYARKDWIKGKNTETNGDNTHKN